MQYQAAVRGLRAGKKRGRLTARPVRQRQWEGRVFARPYH